jgi:hypothetical protein
MRRPAGDNSQRAKGGQNGVFVARLLKKKRDKFTI